VRGEGLGVSQVSKDTPRHQIYLGFGLPHVLLNALLHIHNFAVHERHFDVFVDVQLLGSEIDDLVGLADGGYHLVGCLSLLDLLRWRGCLLRLSSTCLVVSLLVIALLSVALLVVAIAALLSVALISAGAVVEVQKAADGVFDLGGTRIGQRSFWKLEDDFGFVEGCRTDVVAGIAGDEAKDDLVFRHVDHDSGGIHFYTHLVELG